MSAKHYCIERFSTHAIRVPKSAGRTCDNDTVAVNTELLLQSQTLTLIDSLRDKRSDADIVHTVSELKKTGIDAETIHQVLHQVRLRNRARSKFGDYADQMLFTESGLEQSTRLPVAAHHAGRFRDARLTSVADLGCGLGADSMAFAALGLRVQAVESDPVTAALASYNLALFDNVSVHHDDALSFDHSAVEGIWIDPARREGGTKLWSPEQWSPPLDRVFDIARRTPAGVKLAPGMDRDLIPANVEAQWVSHRGDVVELVLWWGGLARPGIKRSALVLADSHSAEISGEADADDAPLRELSEYLYEPDGAVIRARLIGDLARRIGGGMLDGEIAYITSNSEHHTPLAQGFRIHEVLPAKTRELSQWVKRADIGTLEIKKRGLDIDPAALRRRLNPRGSQSATLILTRYQGRRVGLVAERLD